MADIEPPSFSLGLDLDFDSEPPCQAPDSPPTFSEPPELNNESRRPGTIAGTEFPPDPPPLFRRLRRGPSTKTTDSPLPSHDRQSVQSFFDVDDDDIEEFSPDEFGGRSDEQKTTSRVQSVCSGTKFSLHGQGVVTKQPATEPCRKRKQDLVSPSTSSIAKMGKSIFSEVIMSPLRRFELLDSDSDDMSDSGEAGARSGGIKLTNVRKSNLSCSAAAVEKTDGLSAQVSQKVDLWKNFHPEGTCTIATPVLDEFCKEYFRAPKATKTGPDAMQGFCQTQREENKRARAGLEKLQQTAPRHALPPAHCYFFHDDSRIRNLVQRRLCHFQPLFPVNTAGNQQQKESGIDYRSQFNQENSSSKQKSSIRASSKRSSRKVGHSSKSSHGKGTTNSAEEWINPKSGCEVPKDASRRRIHATGGSVGNWYTDENGRKVYVSKSGQELTGQSAYRCYKRERVGGFGKSKKKPTTKRKK